MTAPLVLAGQFGGFMFTDAGKRRMVLQQGECHRLLKVPRALRRRIIGKFRPGEPIRVAITEETDPETGAHKQIVSQVLPEIADVAARAWPATTPSLVVRVCSKKNCWRNGGRELFAALECEAAAGGHAGNIEIRQVGCLDHCKHAPNVALGDRVFARCAPREAGTLIARATAGLLPCEIERT